MLHTDNLYVERVYANMWFEILQHTQQTVDSWGCLEVVVPASIWLLGGNTNLHGRLHLGYMFETSNHQHLGDTTLRLTIPPHLFQRCPAMVDLWANPTYVGGPMCVRVAACAAYIVIQPLDYVSYVSSAVQGLSHEAWSQLCPRSKQWQTLPEKSCHK